MLSVIPKNETQNVTEIFILQVKDFSWLYFYSNTAELSNDGVML